MLQDTIFPVTLLFGIESVSCPWLTRARKGIKKRVFILQGPHRRGLCRKVFFPVECIVD